MLKVISLILSFILFAFGSQAQEKPSIHKIYPPYPDVWGYDLSQYPAFKWGRGLVIDAYRMDDGDVWFLIRHSYNVKDPMEDTWGDLTEQKYILIKFFKGEQKELNEQEMWELPNLTRGKEITMQPKQIQFSNRAILKKVHGHRPKLCTIPDFAIDYLVKIDSNGNEKKFSILAGSPQVRMKEDQGLCDVEAAPYIYQKLYFMSDNLIDLGDDTFITYSRESNLILRFNKELNTQFKPVNSMVTINNKLMSRNFFVIEYDVIENLISKTIGKPIPLYQTVHDELLLYLKEKYH